MRKNCLIGVLHNKREPVIKDPGKVFQIEKVAQRWKPKSENSLTSHLVRDVTGLRGFRAEAGKLCSCSQLSHVLTVLPCFSLIHSCSQAVSASYLSQLKVFLQTTLS